MLTLVDGQPAEQIPVDDRGLAFGDGLFETMAVEKGSVRFLERHLARLQRGCKHLRLTYPKDIPRWLDRLLADNRGESGVVKLMLTRGSSTRGYAYPVNSASRTVIRWSGRPEHPNDYAASGVRLALSSIRLGQQPRLAGIKHLNRLEQVLARAELSAGFQEAVLCDSEGWVIEGIMSNLFLVQDGQLCTPLLDQAGVAGICREVILEQAERHGVGCKVDRFTLADLDRADAILLTNSLIGVWPVAQFNHRNYASSVWGQRLQDWLDEAAQLA